MADELPSHEILEDVFIKRPTEVLESLPDCIASRRAKQLLPTVYDYVVEAREQAKHEDAATLTVAIPHHPTGLCACPKCWSQGC